MHKEYGELTPQVAHQLNQAKAVGRRIICVGTTSVRVLEKAASANENGGDSANTIEAFCGWIDLFILPGYHFRTLDGLITNFHLPRSTLLMLVSAFTDQLFVQQAYQEAMQQDYRFYSFGDAMFIL
jgi:S-adenosylmethionine:tRNA ribosyltransferase-isomerase